MPPAFKRRLTTQFLVVHCSETDPTMDIGVAEIRKEHLGKGWLDVGYHFVIRRNGTIEYGRRSDAIGAHLEHYDDRSLGICLVGQEHNFTPEQMHALASLLTDLKATYPSAEVSGHRDFPRVTKDCPSFDVRSWWLTQVTQP